MLINIRTLGIALNKLQEMKDLERKYLLYIHFRCNRKGNVHVHILSRMKYVSIYIYQVENVKN